MSKNKYAPIDVLDSWQSVAPSGAAEISVLVIDNKTTTFKATLVKQQISLKIKMF